MKHRIIRRCTSLMLMGALTLAPRVWAADATPDISGVWEVAAKIPQIKTADGKTPPLNSSAQKLYDERVGKYNNHDLSYDPTAKCISPGMPRFLYLPYPFQIIQRPKRITYLFQWNYWNRHVDMSGKDLAAPYPLSLGESLGHWEGGALVIKTNGLRADNTMLDAAGMPHSEALTLIEHIRLIGGGKQLQDRISIDDPETFTQPWETVVTFNRLPASAEIPLDICLDRTDAGKPAVDWSRKLGK